MKVINNSGFPFEPKKKGDAGYDLYPMISTDVVLKPNETILVGTGISMQMETYPYRYTFLVVPRSGTGSKGLLIANGTGVIDSGYTGEIKLVLWNRTDENIVIQKGVACAQGIFVPVRHPQIELVDNLEPTERGNTGFGSTSSSSLSTADLIWEN